MKTLIIKSMKNAVLFFEKGQLFIHAEDVNFGTPNEKVRIEQKIKKMIRDGGMEKAVLTEIGHE